MHCDQCFRELVELDPTCLRSRDLRTQVKFCNLTDRTKETNRISAEQLPRLCLCSLCKVYLYRRQERNRALEGWRIQWPSIIWRYLSHPKVLQSEEFVKHAWCMLPLKWRFWWINTAHECITYRRGRRVIAPYEQMHLNSPMPYFVDVTMEFTKARDVEKSLKIADLLEYFKDCSFAKLKCPWGCHEFIGDCGMVSYEHLLFHFTDEYVKCKDFLRAGKDLYFDDNLLGCRKDYLTLPTKWLEDSMDSVNCYRGVIVTKEDGPMVLTCRSHNKGSKRFYIHYPLNPATLNITSQFQNTLAECRLMPRTFRTLKSRKCNTNWEVVQVLGAWNGIDVCYLTDDSTMSTTDDILYKDQKLCFYHRQSTRDYVDYLVHDQNWPTQFRDKLKQDSENEWKGKDVGKYLHGATMISFREALRIQKFTQTKARYITNAEGEDITFSARWPNVFTYIHNATDYGAVPFLCRPWKDYDKEKSFHLSLLVFLVSKFPPLWDSIDCNMESTETWHGWFLEFVSQRHIIPYMQRGRGNSRGGYDNNPFCSPNKDPSVEFAKRINTDVACLSAFSNILASASPSQIKTIRMEDTKGRVAYNTFEDHVKRVNDSSIEYLFFYRNQLPTDNGTVRSHRYGAQQIPLQIGAFKCCLICSVDAPDWMNEAFSIDGVFRHVDKQFTKWWHVCNDASTFPHRTEHCHLHSNGSRRVQTDQLIGGIPYYYHSTWNMIIFVREPESIATLRDRYFDSLGCCSGVYCARHQKALVFAANDDCRKCCFCSKKAKFECAMYNCNLRLCKVHFQDTKDSFEQTNKRQYVDLDTIADVKMSTFHSHDSASQGLESKSSSYMSRSSSSDTSSEDSFDSDTTISSTTNDTSISSSSDNSTDYSQSLHSSNKLEEHDDWKLFIGANEEEEEDKVMHNTVDFMMSNEGADWNEDVSVATSTSQQDEDMIPETAFETIAERNRIYYRNRRYERTNLFILLNNCGNLLMRKGKSVVGNRKQQSFLQRIQARSERSLPLLYPFGLLCPEIMWYEYSDGTIPGALPSCLLTDARQLAKLNIASMHDHTLVALQDYFLKCVNNEKFIELLFSLESNLRLRGKKISLVIGPRGWEELYESGGPKVLNSVKLHNNQFICDETDGYRSVQCLQSMMRDLRSSLFHTSTLNETQFPAVKLVRDEFDRIIEKKQWDHLNDVDQGKNHELALRQASAIHIYRAYHKVMALIFEWITKSSEEPYGPIEEYWIKWENQLETRPTGSNDHSHALYFPPNSVWRDEPRYTQQMLNLIRCCEETLINKQDLEDFKTLNLSFSEEEVEETRSDINRKQGHLCRLDDRCSTMDKDGNRHCRKPNHAIVNPNPNTNNFVALPNCYSEGCKDLLAKLGFMHKHRDGTYTPLDANLKPGFWTYATTNVTQFSPCNPLLALILRSTHNLLLCDPCMSKRYLTNYNALVDSGARVTVTPNRRSGKMEATLETLPNQKIKRNKVYTERTTKPNADKTITAKYTSLPEIFRCLLDGKEIISNAHFVSVPTVPLESRKGIIIRAKRDIQNIENVATYVLRGRRGTMEIGDPLSVISRMEYPEWRHFTKSQIIEIRDSLHSKASICNTKSFCVRPPELRFVNNQTDYVKCFYWKSVNVKKIDDVTLTPSQYLLHPDLYKSAWIDGMERQVYLRKEAIDYLLLKYSSTRTVNVACTRSMCSTIHTIPPTMEKFLQVCYYNYTGCIHRSCRVTWHNFVQSKHLNTELVHHDDDSQKNLPHAIYHNIRPNKGMSFIWHILFRYGTWDTETDLFHGTSYRDFFYNAHLLPNRNDTDENLEKSLDFIMTKYIPEAMGYPTCQRVISRYILQAEALLRDALFTNSIPSQATPAVLYTVLYKNAEVEANKWIKELKLRAITTIHSKVGHLPDLPSIDQFMNATVEHPLHWRPRLLQLEGQTDASYYEKSTALEFLLKKVDAYINIDGNSTTRLHTILHGSPGTGKTFLALCNLLYAVGQGLFSTVTSIPSKRSRECGGIHLAQLLKMLNHSNVSGRSSTTQYSADDILCNLFKHPISLNVIRVLSFLLLEEGGLFNAELISTMSSVFSYVKNSPVYFGGIMTVTTMDIEQLRAIDGHPLLMSPNVLVAYDIIHLKHFVRSRDDPDLQSLLEIMTNWDVRGRQHELAFERILKRHVHFVNSFDDPIITPSHMRVFSKHVAVEQAEKDFVERYVKGNEHVTMLSRKAMDEESERKSFHLWQEAGKHAKTILNKSTKLQEKLLLYNNMKVAMTYNEPGVFDQGQLAIVKLHNLTQRDIDNWEPIHLLISAIGTTVPPPNFENLTESDFKELGWTETYVKKTTSEQKSIHFTRIARRSQYPFRPQNATTTHKIIGDTLPLLVTRVDDVPSSPYYIWEKGGTVVVLSRCEKLSQITIVSPKGPDEAIRVLKSTLSKTDDFYLYTKDIINRHSITFEQEDTASQVVRQPVLPVHRLRHFPYRAIDNSFPDKGAVPYGFLYLLLSKSPRLQDVNTCKIYIGETPDIRHRLNVHNSGCCNTADPSYRPWVPLVYFTGFNSESQRKSLEQRWQNQVHSYTRQHPHLIDCITFVNDIISIGYSLCEDEMQNTKAKITMHQCFVNP